MEAGKKIEKSGEQPVYLSFLSPATIMVEDGGRFNTPACNDPCSAHGALH